MKLLAASLVRAGMLIALLALLVSAAHAKDHEVIQADRLFKPSTITVKAGDTIVFKNADSVVHNVFSTAAGDQFDLRIQKPGDATSRKFDKPGTYNVRCAIHPAMKLAITVAP